MSGGASELTAVEQAPAASALWRRSGPATALALVALLLIFWPTTVFTVSIWEVAGYSHGYLIVPISLYIVWQCPENAQSQQQRQAPPLYPWCKGHELCAPQPDDIE